MVKKASVKQKLFMKRNNVVFSENMSAYEARNRIARFIHFEKPSGIEIPEIKKNLASPKLVDYAKKLGIEVPKNITTQDLRELIDERSEQ